MSERPIVIVTGASQGIGAQTAREFSRRGYHCVLVARNQDRLQTLADEIATGDVEALVCAGDLADLAFVRSVVDQTADRFGRIDALINNAAWRKIGTMRQIEVDEWEQTLRVCLTAPAFLAKWCAAVMQPAGQGVILNVSSIQSKLAPGICPAYVAAKGGLDSLTYELAALYGPVGLRVLSLNLGAIDTEMSADYVSSDGEDVSAALRKYAEDMIPLRRFATAEEIARSIATLGSDDAGYLTGTCVELDGGWHHQATPYSLKRKQFPDEFPAS